MARNNKSNNYKYNLQNKSNKCINHSERYPQFNITNASHTRRNDGASKDYENNFQSYSNSYSMDSKVNFSGYVDSTCSISPSQAAECFSQNEHFNQLDLNPHFQSVVSLPNMCPPQQEDPVKYPPHRDAYSLSIIQASQPPLSVPPPLPNIFTPLSSFQPSVAPPPFPPPFPVLPSTSTSLFSPIDTSVPPPFDSTFAPLITTDQDDKDPKKWIEMRSSRFCSSAQKKPTKSVKITISEYRKKTVNLMTQMKELEKLTTHLHVMSKSLNDSDWTIRKEEVEKQKEIVQKAMEDLKIIPLPEILYLLNKRRSKRMRLKRKRKQNKEIKQEEKVVCQLEHSRIDMWLEKMKDQVERARRDEDIKKQADYVLSEVFHKKTEAKRMLTLLTTLGKLRNARIHDRESKGEFVSKEAAAAFNSIIDKLKKRWLNQINGYNVEEQGLRVMLDDAKAKRSNVEKSLNRQIIHQWLSVIFGKQNKNNPHQVTSVEQLIKVRHSWDQYIVKDSVSSDGSSIPVGWVLPTPPAGEIWAKFVKS